MSGLGLQDKGRVLVAAERRARVDLEGCVVVVFYFALGAVLLGSLAPTPKKAKANKK